MTKFDTILDEIKGYIPIGDKKLNKYFGLDKFKYLMKLVGDPQDKLTFVHITGTCGKGSTTYMIASILKESGYKTGLHVSPHINTPQERVQINNQLISQSDFCRLYETLKIPIEQVTVKFSSPPSYYEILLAIAFLYFYEQKCDLVVVEVGLGGKLDSTNIIKSNYQIITNIGLDHMSILGKTKTAILRDKQEINKPSSIVVSAISQNYLQKILQQKIDSTQSKLFLLNKNFKIRNQQSILNNFGSIVGTSFNLCLDNKTILPLNLNLPGIFQVKNAAVAAKVCYLMQNNFPKISLDSIALGLSLAKVPGRFQYLSFKPMIIVDGAHNPDKTKALVESIENYYPQQKWIIIYRYKRRKDIVKSLNYLSQISHEIIITGSKRWGDLGYDQQYSPEDKVNLSHINFKVELDLDKALVLAKIDSQNRYPILATGSLFMIKEFTDVWVKHV